jgi:hypothetical protein
MFEHYDEVVTFVEYARKQNCTVVFKNERETISPIMSSDSDVRYKLLKYSSIIINHDVGNAYLRYLADLDKMQWDEVG